MSILLPLLKGIILIWAGIRLLAMSGESPRRGSLPLVFEPDDVEQIKGSLRVRGVLLFMWGSVFLGVGVAVLG